MSKAPPEMRQALQRVYEPSGTPAAEQAVVMARVAELKPPLPGPIAQAESDRRGYGAAMTARLGEVAATVPA